MKKILSIFLAGLLSFTMMVPVYANEDVEEIEEEPVEESESAKEKESHEFSVFHKETNLNQSNDELFAHYVDQVFSGIEQDNQAIEKTKGYELFDGRSFEIYCELYDFITRIAKGEESSTVIEIDVSQDNFVFDMGTGIDNELVDHIDSTIDDALELIKIKDCLLLDCPYEFYWYDKSKGYWTSFGYEEIDDNSMFITKIILTFTPSNEFASSEDSVDTDKTGAATRAVENANQVIENGLDYDDYHKLLFYNDVICSLVDYNHEAADEHYTGGYGNPWQLIYVFDGDDSTKVVCEGYSKAFKYLCDMSTFENDIQCQLVTGFLSTPKDTEEPEGHMWNLVHMEDGKNYLVDVTNSDYEDYAGNPVLFLRGAEYDNKHDYYIVPVNRTEFYYKYDQELSDVFTTEQLTLSQQDYGKSASSISVEQDAYILKPGERTSLKVEADVALEYQSSDPEVVSVDENGTLTATSIGEAEITITSEDGESASVKVKVQEALEYLGMNMTLSSDITMNYYISLPDSIVNSNTAYLHFVQPNGKTMDLDIQEMEEEQEDGMREYKFSVGISPKDLTGISSFELMDEDDVLSQTFMVRTDDYLYFLCEELEGTKDAYVADVLLKYGYYAQQYFDYKLDQLPNTYSQLGSNSLKDYKYSLVDNSDKIDFVGARLILTSRPAVKLYFNTDLETVTIFGHSVRLGEEDGYKYCRITDIEDFSDLFTITAPNFELNYGIFSYGYAAQGTNKQALKNLVQAMYDYDQMFH